MQKLKAIQEKLHHKLESAQSLVEYALILVLVGVVVIAVLTIFGETLYSTYTCVLLSTRSADGTPDAPMINNVILFDSDDMRDIAQVNCGLRISKAEIGDAVNIRADTTPEIVGSVYFKLDGPYSREQVENVHEYYAFGNSTSSSAVDDIDLPPGRYTLSVTPYSEKGLEGNAGLTYVLVFTITE